MAGCHDAGAQQSVEVFRAAIGSLPFRTSRAMNFTGSEAFGTIEGYQDPPVQAAEWIDDACDGDCFEKQWIEYGGRRAVAMPSVSDPASGRHRNFPGSAAQAETCDRGGGRPVAGLAAPAARVRAASLLIMFMSGCQQGAVLSGMALCRGHVFDAAVTVFIVVPMDEARNPVAGRVQIGETLGREFRPVFGGAEQGFGVRIVDADARSRTGRLDAQPMEHGEDGGGFQGGAVVAV